MTDRKAAQELAARARKDLEAVAEFASNRRIADEIYGFLAQHRPLLRICAVETRSST